MTPERIPDEIKTGLIVVLTSLTATKSLLAGETEHVVDMIWLSFVTGQKLENQNLPTAKQAEDALEILSNRCNELADQIEMLSPSLIEDLFCAGEHELFALPTRLRSLSESAECASEEYVDSYSKRGRPTLHQAGMVTWAAGLAYSQITGKKPSFTTDKATSEIVGAWPDYLEQVFVALGVSAKARRQAREFVQEREVRKRPSK